MIRNYFKIAIRNLFKDSFYSFINIFGLSIGITACLLILLYVSNELSYDKFHKDHKRIFRVTTKAMMSESEIMNSESAKPLLAEVNELTAILVTSVKNLKARQSD